MYQMVPIVEGVVENCTLMPDEQRPVKRSARAASAELLYPAIVNISSEKFGRETHQLSVELGQSRLPVVVKDKHSVDHDEQQRILRRSTSDPCKRI